MRMQVPQKGVSQIADLSRFACLQWLAFMHLRAGAGCLAMTSDEEACLHSSATRLLLIMSACSDADVRNHQHVALG